MRYGNGACALKSDYGVISKRERTLVYLAVQLTVGDKQLLTILSMATVLLHSNRPSAPVRSRLEAVSGRGGPADTKCISYCSSVDAVCVGLSGLV